MVKIIKETKVEECHKFEHIHKGMDNLLKGLLLGSKFCPECGECLKESRPITTRKCLGCGERLLPSNLYKYKFCPNCGGRFEE